MEDDRGCILPSFDEMTLIGHPKGHRGEGDATKFSAQSKQMRDPQKEHSKQGAGILPHNEHTSGPLQRDDEAEEEEDDDDDAGASMASS